MNNLVTRALAGAVYCAVIVLSICGGGIWFYLVTLLLTIGGMVEYKRLINGINDGDGASQSTGLDMVGALVVWGLAPGMGALEWLINSSAENDDLSLYFNSYKFILGFVVVCGSLLLLYILLRLFLAITSHSANAVTEAMQSVFSLVYVAMPLSILNFITFINPTNTGKFLIMVMFIMIWLSDTGAYCVGSLIGRRKLCERLSPKKSWEGFWGGLLFSGAAGCLAWALAPGWGSVISWIVYGIMVALCATLGDLFESMLKRRAGVKDSGHVIPGHGGVLDRIDSLLTVAIMTPLYWALVLVADFWQ